MDNLKKILIVKTSSMGDVIHTLPAITDAKAALTSLSIDWLVEERFADIASWHPGVANAVKVSLRRWRKTLFSAETYREFMAFYKQLRTKQYDVIIDAQGLLKSMLLAVMARGNSHGFSWNSAREPLATLLYQKRHKVHKNQHAVTRSRILFSEALGYSRPRTSPDFGLLSADFRLDDREYMRSIVLIPSTTWASKHWPTNYWQRLIGYISEMGISIKLSWGSDRERLYALKLAAGSDASMVKLLPYLNLKSMAEVLATVRAVVAVDTGFAHLSEALNTPMISLYGATDAKRTGALGEGQLSLASQFACAPCLKRRCCYSGKALVVPACFAELTPELVWQKLKQLLHIS